MNTVTERPGPNDLPSWLAQAMTPFQGLWIVFGVPVVTVGLLATYITCSLGWEYLHNPNRSAGELLIMVPFATAMASVIALIAQLLTYPALVSSALLLRFLKRVSLPVLLAEMPLLGLLTWFGYDRLVPDYRFMLDEQPPYEHGLTAERFLFAWAWAVAVTLCFWVPLRKPERRTWIV